MALNKTQNLLAAKLGLAEEDKVKSKAAEFERLLQTKTIAGSNITDNSKTVICLDLAAGLLGASLDMKSAIKYSGLKPTMYTNSRKVIQNMLELNADKLSTLVLCNMLQCAAVQTLADQVLEEYRKQSKIDVDLNLPQYVCMAVYQACRKSKVQVSKSKFLEKSRLKPAQWGKLEADWTKFVDANFATAKTVGRRKNSDLNKDKEEKMDVDSSIKADKLTEQKIEPYNEWKKRILEAAYKELKESQMQREKCGSPRRSPRKATLKFSPYKSPTKKNGARLLFPVL